MTLSRTFHLAALAVLAALLLGSTLVSTSLAGPSHHDRRPTFSHSSVVLPAALDSDKDQDKTASPLVFCRRALPAPVVEPRTAAGTAERPLTTGRLVAYVHPSRPPPRS